VTVEAGYAEIAATRFYAFAKRNGTGGSCCLTGGCGT
jgi:hypothetical protein